MKKQSSREDTMSSVIVLLLSMVGIECLGGVTFNRWSSSGLVPVRTVQDFRETLGWNHPLFFIDCTEVTVSPRNTKKFSTNYMGIELNFDDPDGWSATLQTDVEELPHDVGVDKLEARRKMVTEEIEKAMDFFTQFLKGLPN